MEEFKNKFLDFCYSFGPKVLGAVLVVVAGHFIIKLLVTMMDRSFQRIKMDVSLNNFLKKAASIVLRVILILSALTTLGISTTGLLAALSASAVAVALALKDSLGNLAGGILILLSRPFSTGDYIDVSGLSGTVISIDMIHTTLVTPDNRQIVIPNGQMVNEKVVNYSKEECRRMDLTISISYKSDSELAKRVILETVNAHKFTMQTPESPFARVDKQGENSIDIAVRTWCKTENYWTLHYDLMEQIIDALDKEGVTVPIKLLDVRIIENN
ncbi:MAG: mechanosensitive ion channel family protein [Oscillospiraceae bacterium]|nr:mechanosensitive ion channel family protein [Oscillospiraceae bacterium]